MVLTSSYPGLREELAAQGFPLLAEPCTPAELTEALAAARRGPVAA